ncbi:SDR family NAD(P)-dependent oxidoreductase [Pseudoprimorskyibacter insulae]|uniref:Ketoacyl reductase n=1 Tax=Pseudoprimorskyibacter insulae TaxID=1695997 RepID=A0A2R8ATN6_9RHOB|nr:SDR family oxidoreductase [Pseudoprimorskyibacter insulae]SPF79350.1 Putative ketoacyl reductase [Pseudoprimorskyibacter insulae]
MMGLTGKTALVTGAAQGIGRAIATQLAESGVRVILCDLSFEAAAAAAKAIGAEAVACDVRDPVQISAMIDEAQSRLGHIDILISNAGFASGEPNGPTSATDDHWQANWEVHVMAHLRAARLVLPEMIRRGNGWVVNIASAAGLLSQVGDAAYSATKHAAVSLAQSLAIAHGQQGISVSVVCPLYVATPLLGYGEGDAPQTAGVISANDVAKATIEGMKARRFLILPHPEAAAFAQRRMEDTDRWIKGMQKVHDRVQNSDAKTLHDIHKLV